MPDSDHDGLLVSVAGHKGVLLPPAAVEASPVLGTLTAEDLAESCGPEKHGVPLPNFGVDPLAASQALQQVSQAFQSGGFPLALRWLPGDAAGLAAGVAVLHCAQFLDMPVLAVAARDELAVTLAYRCSSAKEVSLMFGTSCSTEGESHEGLDVLASDCLHALGLSVLGERGRELVALWAGGRSPISALPSECLEDMLLQAGGWVLEDPGVCELLQPFRRIVLNGSEACSDDETATAATTAASTSTLEASCFASPEDKSALLGIGDLKEIASQVASAADAKDVSPPVTAADAKARRLEDDTISHALDIVMAHSQRYVGSSLVVAAAAAQALREYAPQALRIRAVKAVLQVASRGDDVAVALLSNIILNGLETAEERNSVECLEVASTAPPRAEAANVKLAVNLGLDASWQLRKLTCEAMASLAHPGDASVVAVLVQACRHGFFEVRAAAVCSLGLVALPSNEAVANALVEALEDDDWSVRAEAGDALSSLACGRPPPDASGPDASESSAADNQTRLRKNAVSTAVGLVPHILERLIHKNSDVRQAARVAVRKLGVRCQDPRAVAAEAARSVSQAAPGRRVPLWKRPSAEVRAAAVEVMGDALLALGAYAEADPAAFEVLECLERALVDRSASVRCAASVALGQPGASGKGILQRFPPWLLARVPEIAASAVETALKGLSATPTSENAPPSPSRCSPQASPKASENSRFSPLARGTSRPGIGSPTGSSIGVVTGQSNPEEALQLLLHSAEVGEPRAVDVAVRALQPCSEAARLSPGARKAAAAALGGIASPGDPSSTAALLTALEDPDEEVAQECFASLDALLPSTLSNTPEHGTAREDAVVQLARLAKEEHVPLSKRCRALQSLARQAPRGDATALDCVIAVLRSSEAALRSEALAVVVRVAEPGSTAARALVTACLRDSDDAVRQRAMDACEAMALGLASENGSCASGSQSGADAEMVEALVSHIATGGYCMRQMATRTLQRVCRRGHPAVLGTLLPWLETGHWPQRQAVLEAVGSLAAPGDPHALRAVERKMSDPNEMCRQTACETIGQLLLCPEGEGVGAAVLTSSGPAGCQESGEQGNHKELERPAEENEGAMTWYLDDDGQARCLQIVHARPHQGNDGGADTQRGRLLKQLLGCPKLPQRHPPSSPPESEPATTTHHQLPTPADSTQNTDHPHCMSSELSRVNIDQPPAASNCNHPTGDQPTVSSQESTLSTQAKDPNLTLPSPNAAVQSVIALLATLEDKSWLVRDAASVALLQLASGPAVPQLQPHLDSLASDSDDLRQAKGASSPLQELLARLLRHGDEEVRRTSSEFLSKLQT
eukprot:TRINITY_DN11948_c0_g1_i1.p1 TRINITY_DN11948_c0_g1~~TRINITY_DN11948_c0_g1_i1.p1  ORF type:complete len:1322 (+),score=297.34 TRINITY_DN11948_c0_g1_i1:15-3980(+)